MPISDFGDLVDSDEWDHGFIELRCLQCGKYNFRGDPLDDLLFPNGYVCSECDPEFKLRTTWGEIAEGIKRENKH